MTSTKPELADSDFAIDTRTSTVPEYLRAYLGRVRGGDMGALPAVLGLVVLGIVFSVTTERFFSLLNISNLIVQAGPICLLAMGLVPVLLLGEIDLSAGVAGGTSAGFTALAIVDHGQHWTVAVAVGLLVGALIGLAVGALVAILGIPSFVVSLAFFLGLQGVLLWLIGEGGSIRVADEVLRGLTINNVGVTAGWVVAVLVAAVFAGGTLWQHRQRVAKGLQHPPFPVVVVRVVAISLVILAVPFLLNQNRGRPTFPIQGIPWVLPVVVVLLLVWTFVLTRTTFGRYLYAVGGNAEAARRAGVNVVRIKVSAFVFCSMMAAASGIVQASYTGKVSASSGGGNVLLYAVGAAVIGGVSLFGGRGRAVHAVIGGLTIATIANGLPLLVNESYANYLVTGGVLLVAASVDALSRRRRSTAGV
ncbi:ABC transporter permease [Nocardioides marinus]|uniref:Xylose transport system permease protein XylH n=1 Tax=Nocardioides marinus TaxID=374514 RepID=A0A7Y9YC31_9ACTN|nr:ABC transporter permease [Nocardioides marinus]NYI09134.1 D-xylose transport system permease protein [Nocardioides marinus]